MLALVESQSDVGGRVQDELPEHQARHVAPQLEGRPHRGAHRLLGEVAWPVHDAVGQVTLVPLLTCVETRRPVMDAHPCVMSSLVKLVKTGKR